MKPIYQAIVTSEGGREKGHVRSAEGIIDLEINMPKELGGEGGKANPELLFAAGYSACFESALQFVAKKNKRPIKKSKVRAKVTIGTNKSGNYVLGTKLEIYLPGYGEDNARKLMQEAHFVCPYSNATRGNMIVDFELMEA
jgi:lipoyl-dependent peroxiredoxin